MSRPEDLRQAAENTLYSLTADESLKFRILQSAAELSGKPSRSFPRTVPVLCTVLAVLLIAVVSLNTLQAVQNTDPANINVFAAGMTDSGNRPLPAGIDPSSVISISMEGHEPLTSSEQCALLTGILIDQSKSADSSFSINTDKLVFTADDGSSYSFFTDDPYLSDGNGQCWSCPGFFAEFERIKSENGR